MNVINTNKVIHPNHREDRKRASQVQVFFGGTTIDILISADKEVYVFFYTRVEIFGPFSFKQRQSGIVGE